MNEEPLKPQSLGPEQPESKTNASASRIWIPVVLLLGVGLGVVGFLSRRAPVPDLSAAATPAPVPAPTSTPDPALRLAAEQALEELIQILNPLREMAPEIWGGGEWLQTEATNEAGDQAMAQQRWADAEQSYRHALQLAQRLQSRRAQAPAALYSRAVEAYASGKRAEAVGLLRAILKIDSEHPEAKALLPRAEKADQSFALLNRAQEHLEHAQPELAYAKSQQLQELDAAFPGAEELHQRIETLLVESELQSILGRGFAALDAGDLTTAQAAVREALSLAPSEAAVVDLGKQVEAAVLEKKILELRSRAEQRAREEDWVASYQVWLEIESLDANAPWVTAGLAEALKWAVIEEKLTKGLSNPGGSQAGIWVEEFRDRKGWPSGLAAKADLLEAEWTAWTTPVQLTLVSDGETEITIRRQGRWKNIIRQEIELLPGSYVAKGGRLGYRDVRVEFEVMPGAENLKVRVVCTEGI